MRFKKNTRLVVENQNKSVVVPLKLCVSLKTELHSSHSRLVCENIKRELALDLH